MQTGMLLTNKYTKDTRKSAPEPHPIHNHLPPTVSRTRGVLSRVISRLCSAFKRGNDLPRNKKPGEQAVHISTIDVFNS